MIRTVGGNVPASGACTIIHIPGARVCVRLLLLLGFLWRAGVRTVISDAVGPRKRASEQIVPGFGPENTLGLVLAALRVIPLVRIGLDAFSTPASG